MLRAAGICAVAMVAFYLLPPPWNLRIYYAVIIGDGVYILIWGLFLLPRSR
jgi:hypothetical protein